MFGGKGSTTKSSQAPVSAKTAAKSDPACLDKWLKAEKAGITMGEGMIDGHMSVMVDEAVYRQLDYATKLGMAQTFECAVVGKDHALTEVYFISDKTAKPLAIWSWGKLEVM